MFRFRANIKLEALLTAAIVRNHPFVDGSKRTGFVVGTSFLKVNGYHFAAPQEAPPAS
ncbi:MAG: type II toxin-antitoxin system death-on-curing family toxin [Bryobacteraceae bacterium]